MLICYKYRGVSMIRDCYCIFKLFNFKYYTTNHGPQTLADQQIEVSGNIQPNRNQYHSSQELWLLAIGRINQGTSITRLRDHWDSHIRVSCSALSTSTQVHKYSILKCVSQPGSPRTLCRSSVLLQGSFQTQRARSLAT